MKKFLFLLLIGIRCVDISAQQVDTVEVLSHSMNAVIKNIVILPAGYDGKTDFPVLYLLHGYGGNHTSWMQIKPGLPGLATQYGMIIVCPDGKNSWYWDSPVNPKIKYETYVSAELVHYMDDNYKTRKDGSGRAITGLSMGGHGGLWLGIRHQDVFGACGATSGGVDIRPFPGNWEMKDALGDYDKNRERWDHHTVINQLHLVKEGLAIIVDCGTEDFFHEVNESLHREMLYHHIKHDYISRPGVHNGAYWSNSIEYQLLFFSRFFRENAPMPVDITR
ncbi:MAG: esterase family protein [Tannerella sp.]|jgi:S-formylglutathione hydrolase FrmB|nr:esterase family protein [Tannerella sp.]